MDGSQSVIPLFIYAYSRLERMNIKPPTTAAMIAAAASTMSTMVNRFRALYELVSVAAIVAFAAVLTVERSMLDATLETINAATIIKIVLIAQKETFMGCNHNRDNRY